MYTTAEYYQSILDNLTGGFLSVSLDGAVVYVNPTAGRILHLKDLAALIGKDYAAALGAFPALCAVVRDALATHQTVHRAEVSVLHGDAPLIIGYSTLQVKNRAGEYLGLGIIFQDLTFVKKKA
ncbi:MAG: PAS domain-containing protein [Elusimicrobiota bacterium]|nr:PAS domain-containing protein [Elusimicrobiota bacterium]